MLLKRQILNRHLDYSEKIQEKSTKNYEWSALINKPIDSLSPYQRPACIHLKEVCCKPNQHKICSPHPTPQTSTFQAFPLGVCSQIAQKAAVCCGRFPQFVAPGGQPDSWLTPGPAPPRSRRTRPHFTPFLSYLALVLPAILFCCLSFSGHGLLVLPLLLQFPQYAQTEVCCQFTSWGNLRTVSPSSSRQHVTSFNVPIWGCWYHWSSHT